MTTEPSETRKTRVELLSEELLRYILEHRLEPGDRLPNEYGLAAELHAGRSTVREAVKVLISRNVVEVRQGAGTYVSSKLGVPDDPLGFSFVRDRRKLGRDLLEVRFLIEPPIAAMAARNADERELEEIVRLCDETEAYIRAGENHLEKDIALHTAIARSSGNLVVPRLIPVINSSIGIFIDLTHGSLLEETVTTHREIVDAIIRRDPVAAQDAMYLHLIHNRRRIDRELEKPIHNGGQKENREKNP
ncbi:MAG: FadR family transcriptional regulator [Lentisphaeria bacterium]|nr:FadR family transcriptional regulator [Lentisphaeria bacterium]